MFVFNRSGSDNHWECGRQYFDTYCILDTKDGVMEYLSKDEIISLYRKVPNLNIKGMYYRSGDLVVNPDIHAGWTKQYFVILRINEAANTIDGVIHSTLTQKSVCKFSFPFQGVDMSLFCDMALATGAAKTSKPDLILRLYNSADIYEDGRERYHYVVLHPNHDDHFEVIYDSGCLVAHPWLDLFGGVDIWCDYDGINRYKVL